MKSEAELRREVRRIRERVKSLSGFWIGEASAAIYALEWAVGKREAPASEDIGRAHGGREKIAVSLMKLVERAPVRIKSPSLKPRTPARRDPRPSPKRRI